MADDVQVLGSRALRGERVEERPSVCVPARFGPNGSRAPRFISRQIARPAARVAFSMSRSVKSVKPAARASTDSFFPKMTSLISSRRPVSYMKWNG